MPRKASILKTPLPKLKPSGKSKWALERGSAKAEVEIVDWNENGDNIDSPFVSIRLEWVEDTMSSVWVWWTDHYWDLLRRELPGFLKRYCPAPEEVWATLLETVTFFSPSDIGLAEDYDT